MTISPVTTTINLQNNSTQHRYIMVRNFELTLMSCGDIIKFSSILRNYCIKGTLSLRWLLAHSTHNKPFQPLFRAIKQYNEALYANPSTIVTILMDNSHRQSFLLESLIFQICCCFWTKQRMEWVMVNGMSQKSHLNWWKDIAPFAQ